MLEKYGTLSLNTSSPEETVFSSLDAKLEPSPREHKSISGISNIIGRAITEITGKTPLFNKSLSMLIEHVAILSSYFEDNTEDWIKTNINQTDSKAMQKTMTIASECLYNIINTQEEAAYQGEETIKKCKLSLTSIAKISTILNTWDISQISNVHIEKTANLIFAELLQPSASFVSGVMFFFNHDRRRAEIICQNSKTLEPERFLYFLELQIESKHVSNAIKTKCKMLSLFIQEKIKPEFKQQKKQEIALKR